MLSEIARVFVQLRLPEDLEPGIVNFQKELSRIDSQQVYNERSSLHVSIASFAFLKSVADWSAYEGLISWIRRIASEISPFRISIRGVDSFPTVVYGKVYDSSGSLQRIKSVVDAKLNAIDFLEPIVFGVEYVPHVTIAEILTNNHSALLEAMSSEHFRSYDFGTGVVKDIEVKELNVPHFLNHHFEGKLSSFRRRFSKEIQGEEFELSSTKRDHLSLSRKRIG